MLDADGVEVNFLKQPHMRKREVQLHKYAAEWFLIYQYKNILNKNMWEMQNRDAEHNTKAKAEEWILDGPNTSVNVMRTFYVVYNSSRL